MNKWAFLIPAMLLGFAPITITEQDYNSIMQFLNDNVPPRYGNPISQFFSSREADAAKEEKARDAKQAPPKPPVAAAPKTP